MDHSATASSGGKAAPWSMREPAIYAKLALRNIRHLVICAWWGCGLGPTVRRERPGGQGCARVWMSFCCRQRLVVAVSTVLFGPHISLRDRCACLSCLFATYVSWASRARSCPFAASLLRSPQRSPSPQQQCAVCISAVRSVVADNQKTQAPKQKYPRCRPSSLITASTQTAYGGKNATKRAPNDQKKYRPRSTHYGSHAQARAQEHARHSRQSHEYSITTLVASKHHPRASRAGEETCGGS